MLVLMPSDREWADAFARLGAGQSSYRDEAKLLGVNAATVLRQHLEWLEGKVRVEREKLGAVEKRLEVLTKQDEELGDKLRFLSGEYEQKKSIEEKKLAEFLGGSRNKLSKTRSQITELEKVAKNHGFGCLKPSLSYLQQKT